MIHERRLLPDAWRAEASRKAARKTAALPELAAARCVHLYLPIPGSSELDTAPLAELLHASGCSLAVPYLDGGAMRSATYRPGMALRPSSFGSPEPLLFEEADERHIDVVVLPLLAADRRGMRLGFGKGWYDRLLAAFARRGIMPLRLGIGFSSQLLDELPAESHDEPLDLFVHENGVLRFNSNNNLEQ